MTTFIKNGRQPEGLDILVSLSEEELKRVPPLSEQDITKALDQGRTDRDAFEANARPVPANSKIFFR